MRRRTIRYRSITAGTEQFTYCPTLGSRVPIADQHGKPQIGDDEAPCTFRKPPQAKRNMGMSIMTTTTSKEAIQDITKAIESVVKDAKERRNTSDNTSSDSMNIEPAYAQEYTPVTAQSPQCSDRSTPKGDVLGQMIPPLLKRKGGLSEISQETLRENLQPIVQALQKLDAEMLLGLQRSSRGPQLREGVFCRPIYDEVTPAVANCDTLTGQSCVRYLHISEIPDQYSIGIFVFAPYSRIPLHDHPDMCVLSRVLYGDLQRTSLDLAKEDEMAFAIDSNTYGDKTRRTSWLGNWWNKVESFRTKLPKGTKQAYKNHVDYLQAPDVTVLYPYEGNLHEFVAGPDGAAVLDVLLPPYDNTQNRDCTFYEIQEISSSWPKPSGKEPCFIIPTGQPEDFHCISGQYRELGEGDDFE